MINVIKMPMDQAEQIRDWLKQVMENKSLSGNAWATQAKVAPSTVTRPGVMFNQ